MTDRLTILPSALVADEIDELNTWLDARNAEAIEAHADDAAQSTRDDGSLYHGRLPCDDVDPFNPCFAAFAPPPAIESLPSWMERKHGGDPIGTGLPPFAWEVAS